MASCLSTTTTLQSFPGVPVASLVNKKTFGQANGINSCGCVASNTMRCFPLILLNHASGSAWSSGKKNCSACASNGAIETVPKAAAPAAIFPKKSRREEEFDLLVCIYSQILVIEMRGHG